MAMRLQSLLLGVLLLTGFAAADSKTTAVIPSRYSSASLNRSSFPSGFVFGSASASYQVSVSALNKLLVFLFNVRPISIHAGKY